jgi:hypothetical protein
VLVTGKGVNKGRGELFQVVIATREREEGHGIVICKCEKQKIVNAKRCIFILSLIIKR